MIRSMPWNNESQSLPPVVAVLAKHSFTPREFVVFGLTLFQSAFAASHG